MNSNRPAKGICVIISAFFSATFLTLLIMIVLNGYENVKQRYTYSCSFAEHIIIVGLFIAFTSAVILFVALRQKFRSRSAVLIQSFSEKYYLRITIGIIIAVFAIQVFCVTQLRVMPENDLAYINHYAVDFARTGSFDELKAKFKAHYAIKYPNNLGIIILMSFVYRAVYLITGETSDFLPVILNVFAINISIILTVKLARKLFGSTAALTAAGLSAVFLPFYTYSVYYYTDTLSMPFITGALYLFFMSQDTENVKKRYMLAAFAGAVCFLGYFIKGNAAILLPCMAVFAVLKLKLKRALAVTACLILSFVLLFGGLKFVIKPALIPEEMSERYQYPYTHWVMMGLNGYGDFHKKDSSLTAAQKTVDAKKLANIKKIKARLRKKGVAGLVNHLSKKAVWTWSDGTYYVSHHIDSYSAKSFLHEFVLIGGKHYFLFFALSSAYQLFMILMMICSGIRAIKAKRIDFTLVLRIAVFGLFLFLLIWETRPRYLLNFSPLFIILSVDGIHLFLDIMKGCRKKRQPCPFILL